MELSEQLVPLVNDHVWQSLQAMPGEVKMGLPVELLYRFSSPGAHMLLDGLTLSNFFFKKIFSFSFCRAVVDSRPSTLGGAEHSKSG